MWSGKMATRGRRKDGHFKPGNGHFLPTNSPDELNSNTEMDTQASVDHSILAIFEDASLSEDKAAAEEDSVKLLSALTEMLEQVEDDDVPLCPFSSLPETSILNKEISLLDTFEETFKTEGANESGNKLQNGALIQPVYKKVDTEVEVFTSLSLVNLVKIMHPYCLKLQVEDEEPEKASKNSVLFSKEEVWKYERPTEDMDEEINVVSDDEGSISVKTQENSSKPLKSALLNGSPSKKEKKRVSFGLVQVTSFDLDSQTNISANSAAQHSPKSLDNDSTLQAANSSENDQIQNLKPKRKLLSLQQYRQLREKRQPLVEKQGNYTTKWPAVSVPPKELTPILGVNGQKQSHLKPAAMQHATNVSKASSNCPTVKIRASGNLPHKAKRPKPNEKSQHVPVHPDLPAAVCKISQTKKQALSSDPPNPVLLPLPIQHPPMNEPALHQNEKYSHSLQSSEDAGVTKSNTAAKCINQSAIQAQENKNLPNILDLTNQCDLTPANSPPSLPYEPPTPVSTPVSTPISTPVKETPEVAFGISSPSQHSGIEASDLTSLLEQFEETQAKEEGESERALQVNSGHLSKLDGAASNSILQPGPLSSDPTFPAIEALSSTPRIPEAFGTEVILGTQEQPVRRKAPPIKAIQIIDPRPMPFKRTHTNQAESTYTSPHVCAAISSDHDYCTVSDGDKTSKSNQSETTEIQQANSNQISEEVKHENSVEKCSIEDHTKPPTVQPTLLTDPAKKQNSSASCEIRLDPCIIPPTPPPSPPPRGRGSSPFRGRDRGRRRYRKRSRSSDSSSSSCSSSSSSSSSGSRSPKRQKRHYGSSESSSGSSSPCSSVSRSPQRHKRFSRTRFSRSRSSSWSQSRSRSRSYSPPQRVKCRRAGDVCSSRQSRKLRREQEVRAQKLRAIDERRVVYVGRIRRTMTHEELRERFTQFGDVESVSLHFRDRGDHYGFVTFYNMEDAFAAIDNGGKLRRPDELPFDICFGGRRQFCNSNYADLDANRDVDRSPVRSRFEEVDFDLLLKQAQKGLKR